MRRRHPSKGASMKFIKYAPGEVRLKDFARAIEAAHGITGEKT
jgi:hypothetical protein